MLDSPLAEPHTRAEQAVGLSLTQELCLQDKVFSAALLVHGQIFLVLLSLFFPS